MSMFEKIKFKKYNKAFCSELFAFTLAEVLITLGIIGIVAAMTIPNLINKTQNKENEVAFKKMYSNLNNALNQVTQQNGGVPYRCFISTNGYVSDECSTFWTEMFKIMTPIKTCSGGTDNNCQPSYHAIAGHCSGPASPNNKTTYILKDGSMIMSYNTSLGEFGYFIIDVNGFKKPNEWGHDVFVMNIFPKNDDANNLYIGSGSCFATENNGVNSISEILTAK